MVRLIVAMDLMKLTVRLGFVHLEIFNVIIQDVYMFHNYVMELIIVVMVVMKNHVKTEDAYLVDINVQQIKSVFQ